MNAPHTLTHDHYGEPLQPRPATDCGRCGSNNVTMLHIPGRVIGGTWIPGTPMSDCHHCGARTINREDPPAKVDASSRPRSALTATDTATSAAATTSPASWTPSGEG